MSNLATIPLHDLLSIAAQKARSHMGEGRAHVHFQEMLEAAARFSEAHYRGCEMGMFDAAESVFNRADEMLGEVEEPDAPDAGRAEESRVFEAARAL